MRGISSFETIVGTFGDVISPMQRKIGDGLSADRISLIFEKEIDASFDSGDNGII